MLFIKPLEYNTSKGFLIHGGIIIMQCTYDISKCDSITKDFSKGALVWYDFRQGCEILYMYSDNKDSAIIELLKAKG